MASEHSNFNEISISNLEVAQDIGKNDYFLIQPQSFNNSAKILPFRNMIIGLDNVSFAQTIKTHTNEISANTDAINSLSSTVSTITSKLSGDIDTLIALQSYTIVNTVLNCFFPIGSIYINIDDRNPSAMFFDQYGIKTTWERITDRVLIGAGGEYAPGSTGDTSPYDQTTPTDTTPPYFAVYIWQRTK